MIGTLLTAYNSINKGVEWFDTLNTYVNTPERVTRGRKVTGIHKKTVIASYSVGHRYNDFRDYMSTFILYLPYAPTITLNASEIVGHTLKIDLYLDVRTGALKYSIFKDSSTLITMVGGQIRVDLPVTRIDKETNGVNIGTSALTTGVATVVGGVMTGGVGAVVGAGLGLASGGANLMTELKKPMPVQIQGGFGGGTCVDDPLGVYLIEYLPTIEIEPSVRNKYGKPCKKVDTIGNNSGWVECSDAIIGGTATESEKAEIIRLLQSGVIV